MVPSSVITSGVDGSAMMLTKHGLTLVLNVGQFQSDKSRDRAESLAANNSHLRHARCYPVWR